MKSQLQQQEKQHYSTEKRIQHYAVSGRSFLPCRFQLHVGPADFLSGLSAGRKERRPIGLFFYGLSPDSSSESEHFCIFLLYDRYAGIKVPCGRLCRASAKSHASGLSGDALNKPLSCLLQLGHLRSRPCALLGPGLNFEAGLWPRPGSIVVRALSASPPPRTPGAGGQAGAV